MAYLTPPPAREGSDYTTVPADVYNAVIMGVKEVPNKFYVQGESPESQRTQLEWDVTISDGEYQGKKYRYWTQAYISRKGNKFTRLVATADPDYDPTVGYPGGVEELEKRLSYKPVRITTEVKPGVRKLDDGTTEDTEFSRITGFLKANAKVDSDWLSDQIAKSLGGTPTNEPF